MSATGLTALAVWGICAGTKRCLLAREQAECKKFRGAVRFAPLWNEGPAFGLLPLRAGALLGASAAGLAAAACLHRRSPVGAGLLLGGGISNLWERATEGRVYDYLQVPKAPGPLGRVVWNLADLAILSGALTVAVHEKRRGRAKADDTNETSFKF